MDFGAVEVRGPEEPPLREDELEVGVALFAPYLDDDDDDGSL